MANADLGPRRHRGLRQRAYIRRVARHSHDEFVISANVCGVEQVRLDRRRFTLGTDELTLYNPGEVQSCRASVDDDERWSCASIYLDPDVVSRRLGYDAEFHAPVVAAPQLRAQLLQVALARRTG